MSKCSMGFFGLWAVFAASVAQGQGSLVGTYGGSSYTFLDYTYQGVAGRLFVPDGYDSATPIAVVTFMHGLGEKGSNNVSQVVDGSGNIRNMGNLIQQANARGYMVYLPQSEYGWWAETPVIADAIGQLAIDYNVDAGRVYLTGLSAGGSGTMKGLREHSTLFSAFAPLSVASRQFTSVDDAAVGVDVPTWYFGGFNDNPYRNNGRNSYLNTLRAQGVAEADLPTWPTTGTNFTYASPAGPTRITEFANGAHNNNTWNNGAYATEALYDWMLSQSNGAAAPREGVAVRLSLHTGADDVAGAVDDNGRFFNTSANYNKLRVAETFARDEQGQRTSVVFNISDTFQGRGATTASGFDDASAGGYWQLYRYGDADNQDGQIEIHGLESGGLYDVGLFASVATDVLGDHVGVYTINDQTVIIDAANNDQEVLLQSLTASLDGVLVLDVGILQDAQGQFLSRYAVLNSISVTAVPEPTTAALLLVGLRVAVRRPKRSGSPACR